MNVKAYDNKNNIIFETEFEIENPISSYLIDNNLKEVPEHYYDNSFEGLNLRCNTKTTNKDIECFNKISNISNNLKEIMLDLEMFKNVKISKDDFDEFEETDISFFKNFYENILDEFKSELDNVEMLVLSLDKGFL